MSNRHLLRILLFIGLAVAVTLALVYRNHFDATELRAWVQDAGAFAPLLFMLVYALSAVLFLPGLVVTLAGGALFGPVLGTFYNLTGATLGAMLAFLVARYLASDWVTQKAGPRIKRLIDGVEGEGWRFVAFVRLVPLFPYNLLNYALGLTRIRFVEYVVATYIFMLPASTAYTYLGYAGREAVAGGEGLIQKGLLALGLLALVAFLPKLIGNLRRSVMLSIADFKQRIETGDGPLILDVRTADDFIGEQGHITNAHNIPVDDLSQRMGELEDYRERPIAIVCRTDKKSVRAALLLSEKGFADVHVVRGGMTKWHEEGLPVER